MPGMGNRHKSLKKHGSHNHKHKSEICSHKKQKVHKHGHHGHKDKKMCYHGRRLKGGWHSQNRIDLQPLDQLSDSGAILVNQMETNTLQPSESKTPGSIVSVDAQRCEACGNGSIIMIP